MRMLDILKDARAMLDARPYQTRYFAALDTGELEEWHDTHGNRGMRPKWVMCKPDTPGCMLSFHGAIIAAAGSGPLAWRVFDAIGEWGINIRTREIATKEVALVLLDECIRSAERRNVRQVRLPELVA